MLTAFLSEEHKSNRLLHNRQSHECFRAAGQPFLGKAVLTSFSSVIRSQILLTVFARARSKSYTHGRIFESKVNQESEEKNDTDADKEYGKTLVADTWAMRKAGLRRLSKCEHSENIEIQLDKI